MLIKITAVLISASMIFGIMVMLFPKQPDDNPNGSTRHETASQQPRIIAPAMPHDANTPANYSPAALQPDQACTIDYSFPGQIPGKWALLEVTQITPNNHIVANEIGFSAGVAPSLELDLWGIHTLQPGHERHHRLQLYLHHAFAKHQTIKIFTVAQHSSTRLSVIATLNGEFLNTHLVEIGFAIPKDTNPPYPITDCIMEANQAAIDLRNGIYAPLPPPKLPPPGDGTVS